MSVVKVIRIFKNENYYLYIRKTLPHNYAKMKTISYVRIVQHYDNRTQSLKSKKYPLPNFVADLCHTKSN